MRRPSGLRWHTTRAVLGQPQLRRAELAFAATLTADWIMTVALSVVAFEDGGATAVAAVGVARMLPAALATPVLAAVADRSRRERTLVAISMVRTATIGAIAALLASDAPHVFVYVLVVITSVAMAEFRPVHSSLLPLLCTTTRELAGANVVRGTFESLATLVGPVLAGMLLAWTDAAAAFGAAALLSVVAGLLLVGIRTEGRPTQSRPNGPLLAETVEGLRSVVGHRDLRWIFGLGSAQAFIRGALNVFIVVIAIDLLELGNAGVATLSAAIGVGGVIGSFAVVLLVGSRHLGRWLAVSLVLWGTPIVLIGASPATVVAFGLLAVVGLANALIDVPLFTLPVRLVRDEVLSRTFGAFESSISLGVALGAGAAALLIRLLGSVPAMAVAGAVLPALALIGWRPLSALDERLGVRDVEIRLLRNAEVLRMLPVPSIEYLATRVVHRRVPADEPVYLQGDPGESFFVIGDGRAAIVGDGRTIRTVGPGDTFGEIALLRNVPRTATVDARTDLDLLEVDRDTFLDVVGGHRSTREAVESEAAARLADFHPARWAI